MRIVDRATFLAMPAGTLFAKYAPCYYGEIAIKEDSLENDFIYQSLLPNFTDTTDSGDWADALDQMETAGASHALDYDRCARDGFFDADQLFAVFEPHDTAALIARLQQAQADATVR